MQLYDIKINSSHDEKKCLSTLLPYDIGKKTKGALEKSLKEYLVLLEILNDAIKAFKDGKLDKFDALVGENSCQIRSIILALIAKNSSLNYSIIKNEIITNKSLINELLLPKTINFYMSSDLSLKDILEQKKLSVFLNEDEFFLFQSYVLTEVKISDVKKKVFSSLFANERTEITNLKKYKNVTTSFFNKLVKKIRILISYKSVEFIKTACTNLENLSFISQVFDDFIVKHNNLYCIPTYFSIKVMIHVMAAMNIPLIVKANLVDKYDDNKFIVIDEKYLVFMPSKSKKDNFTFKQIPKNKSYSNEPVIIFEGIVLNNYNDTKRNQNFYNSFIDSFDIKTILLATSAAHRQYPDKNLDNLVDNLNYQEYKEHKKLAEKEGFSINNPKKFLVRHIYTLKSNELF